MPWYRKRNDSDTWHWCEDCPQFPKNVGETGFKKKWMDGKNRPTNAGEELCNTCKSFEDSNTCKTSDIVDNDEASIANAIIEKNSK